MKDQPQPQQNRKHYKGIKNTICKSNNNHHIDSNHKQYKTRSSDRPLLECLICYNGIICQGQLNCCNHEFCFGCIHRWSKLGKTSCPVCRKQFNQIETKQIRIDYNESKKNQTVPKVIKIKSHLINIRFFENPSFQRLAQMLGNYWTRVFYDHQS